MYVDKASQDQGLEQLAANTAGSNAQHLCRLDLQRSFAVSGLFAEVVITSIPGTDLALRLI